MRTSGSVRAVVGVQELGVYGLRGKSDTLETTAEKVLNFGRVIAQFEY